MPLYCYECQKCEAMIEITQKFSDEPIKNCADPDCNGELKKVIGGTSFKLKGRGWYANDYKGKTS